MTNKNKRIFIATIGTFLEWAEFTYYAYIASEISTLFFPTLNTHLALIATFSVFALGYFFRPMGALFFGYIGDKFGRRQALQSSIMLLGLSSVLIGCLPTYSSIGVAAPILLLVFRSLQGFAVSGELNGCAIYLMEHDEEQPCLAGSWTCIASAGGMMLGSLMSVLIYLPFMPIWAWRLPFLLGACSCCCALYFRKKVSESPAFLKIKAEQRNNPLAALFKGHKTSMAKALCFISATGVYLYIMNIYYSTHLAQYTTLTSTQMKIIVTFGQGMVVLFIALIARVADKFDEQRILTFGFIGFFIAAPLVYFVPMSNSFILILLAQTAYALCDALVSVPLFKILNSLFPTQVRYSGISASWNISMALFGGTAPLVASYLQQQLNNPAAPILYILLAASIALFALGKQSKIPYWFTVLKPHGN